MNVDRVDAMKLSEILRETSKVPHAEVESTAFAKNLANGKLSQEEYVKYLTALKPIYCELEQQLTANHKIEALESFTTDSFKVLYRTEAIEKDLLAFGMKEQAPVAGVKDYVGHLKEIAKTKPHLLIAHVYIRYLGDLFGGQMIMKKIETLWPGKIAFYHYAAPLDKKPMLFVRKFKQLLDEAPLDTSQINEVAQEALWAYKQHTVIFSQLEN
jgi:heme oxygenase